VTGSGRSLGKEVARHLAGLGATVVVNSFHSRELGEKTADEIVTAGGSAVHIWASMANDAQRDALFDQIESQLGALDFFVHCASNGTLAPIDKITSDDWDKAFRTNVVGLHQGAIRAAALMQRRGGGRIVSLSMTATDRVFEYAACQSTVKAAIESLTRYLAVELAPRNIRVNCIKAGAIYGDVVNQWPDTKTLTPAWEQRAPLGRMCRPSDVCALLSALLADDLEFMTGATLVLDGGHSVRL
jgi:NAD(P)-dependent dehydrogenase (short-subunit alcohol dehydrogenase family)